MKIAMTTDILTAIETIDSFHKVEGSAQRYCEGMEDIARNRVTSPIRCYRGLNTPEGYAAAPEHIQKTWDKATA